MEAASAMSMDRLFGKIKQLPTIPKLLHELMQSFNDENARIDEIAAKIAMDQVISVKVLRMANSAALRRGNEITSIEQAVIRLGFNRLRSVVVASGIISSFKAPPALTSSTSGPRPSRSPPLPAPWHSRPPRWIPRPPSPAPSFTTSASC